MAPSTTSTRVIASARSRSNVPVATRAIETTPTSSIAAHGVPPALTRANTPGASPSRANPKITRGVTNTLPLSPASTTSSASAAITMPLLAPKIAWATSPATRFDAAIRSMGKTCRNAALSSR